MIGKLAKNSRLGTMLLNKFTPETYNAIIDYQKPITLPTGSITTWDMSKSYNAHVTLTVNSTLILNKLTPGDYGQLKITQGGAGSYTLTLPTAYTNKVSGGGAGAVTLSTAVGDIDFLGFYFDGTTLFWVLSSDFS